MDFDLRGRSIRAVAWSAMQSWGNQFSGLLIFTVLARLLSPADFGLIAMAGIYITLVQVFMDQGMTMAIIQRKDLEDAHKSTAFWLNVATGALLTLAGILLAPFIAMFFSQPELEPVIRWLSPILFIRSFSSVPAALLQRNLNFRAVAIRSLLAMLIGGGVGVYMAFSGYGVWSLVGQQITINVVYTLTIFFYSRWRPQITFSIPHLISIYGYGLNVLGINLLEFVNRQMDNLLVGFFLGPTALGYYTLAYKLYTTIVTLLSGIASGVAFSTFSTLQNDIPRLRRAFYSAVRISSLVSFPVFAGMAILAISLIHLGFGEKWSASVPVLQILCLVGILESIYYYNGNVIMAMGKPEWRLRLNLLSAVVNTAGFAIAVKYGIVAVAAAYVIRSWLLSPLPLYLVKLLIDINLKSYLKQLFFPLMGSLTMMSALYFAMQFFNGQPESLIELGLYVLSGIICYALFMAIAAREAALEFFNLFRAIRFAKSPPS